MNHPVVRLVGATLKEVPQILSLMKEYYEIDHLNFDERVAADALKGVLTDDRLGRIWMLFDDGGICGYVVLMFGCCLEFGGRIGYIDEFYVRQAHRQKGIGSETLAVLKEYCRLRGFGVLRLEVERANADAGAFYIRNGFTTHSRNLMTCRL